MRLLLDEHIPTSVEDFLRSTGADVERVVQLLAPGATDRIIAILGEHRRAIIVTEDRDFDRLIPLVPKGHRREFRELGRISLQCKVTQMVPRLTQLWPYIAMAAERAAAKGNRRLIVAVRATQIVILE